MLFNAPVISAFPASDLPAPDLFFLYRQDVRTWFERHQGLAHWWSPDGDVLRQALEVLKDVLALEPQSAGIRVFHDGDFLVLLRSLNALIGGIGAPVTAEGSPQVWVLHRADRIAADHLDILRRIVLNYPELQVRLIFLSVTSDPPVVAEGVHQAQIPVEWNNESSQTDQPAQSLDQPPRYWPWILACLVLAAAGVWWGASVFSAGPSPGESPPTAQPASGPASGSSQPSSSPTDLVTQWPDQQASSAVAASEPAAAVSPTPPVEAVPGAPVSASRRWLLGLPEKSLVVVHAETGTVREAENFRAAGQPILANARILLAEARNGRPERYLVVTAPFRSMERAQAYMQRLQWKAQARSVMREELLSQVPR